LSSQEGVSQKIWYKWNQSTNEERYFSKFARNYNKETIF